MSTDLSPEEQARLMARRAAALAARPDPPPTGETLQMLAFWLGGERYALPVDHVREIYPLPRLTPVPRTPDFVAGVFNARGRILSAVDLRLFMGLSATRRGEQSRVILVADDSRQPPLEVGLLADSVTDLITVFRASIRPPLPTHSAQQAAYVQGIARGNVVVLNLDNVLQDERLIINEDV